MTRLSRAQRYGLTILWLLLAGLYLWWADFPGRIETDVSSILPQGDQLESRLAREIINQQQAHSAYFVIEPSPAAPLKSIEEWLETQLATISQIARATRIDEDRSLVSTSWSEDDRIALLFPKWLARANAEYQQLEPDAIDFPSWAAGQSVARLDTFLQSPESIELIDSPIFDPMLLTLDAFERLESMQAPKANGQTPVLRYWIELNGSGLDQAFQLAYLQSMIDLQSELAAKWPGSVLTHGGLIDLAAASRERIQKDVYTINLISLIGVALVAYALIRRVVPLLAALPTMASAALGGAVTTCLFFDRISVIVIVIGSILIGTSIDYAMHMLLRSEEPKGVSSRKLLFLSCLSTVAGFCALLLSNVALVRQVGAFVAGGLIAAFFVASLIRPLHETRATEKPYVRSSSLGLWIFAVLATGLVVVGFSRLHWKDDIADLEAAAPEIVEQDIALRERMGAPAAATTLVTSGTTFLDALENQAKILEASSTDRSAFAMSQILPTRQEVLDAGNNREEVLSFFTVFAHQLEQSGYDTDTFSSFFDAARIRFANDSPDLVESVESKISTLANSLIGPAAFLLGSDASIRWTVLTSAQEAEVFADALANDPNSISLSSKRFLSGYLAEARQEMLLWGSLALGVVAILIRIGCGARLGFFAIGVTLVSVACSLAAASLLHGDLNLFHLIGCFLGVALSLDYALFSGAYYSTGKGTPQSVWLSFGTTAVAFLALLQSAIPMVRSLGLMVLLITSFTILVLTLSRSIASPKND